MNYRISNESVFHHVIYKDGQVRKDDSGHTPYLSLLSLDEFPFLRHGFSSRLGGVSSGIYESMNVGFNRGDSDENVLENYKRLCNELEIPVSSLVFSDQVHKDVIQVVTKQDCGKGILYPKTFFGVDGMVTKEKEVGLVIFGADCVPIFLVDPVLKVIGAVHSGWRGTVIKAAKKTVEKMQQEYGCLPENLHAIIGPSICRNCYEVGLEVAMEFQRVFAESEWSHILEERKENEKYQLDLWEANRLILMEAGLCADHIRVSGVCTCCHSDTFFSHRASHGQRGSMAGFIMLQPE